MSPRRRVILVVIVLATLAFFLYDRSRTRRHGPESPAGGYTVLIECKDAGFGPGADYLAHIAIKDTSGEVVARWNDPSGQKSIDGLERLIDSMTWTSPRSLGFTSHPDSRIRLSIPAEP